MASVFKRKNPSRVICIGDVHGCLHEAQHLVKKVEYRPGVDRLIFLGDLIDRGPFPAETVRWVRTLPGAEAVLGNHEAKMLDFLRKEARAASGGKPNGMRRPEPTKLTQWFMLSKEDLAWIRFLPLALDLGQGWMAVHGGFEPKPLVEQDSERVVRIRWVDAAGEYTGLKQDSFDRPPGVTDWQKVWNGDHNVVYGHSVQRSWAPRYDRSPSGAECVGIDTGCYAGGNLTAFILSGEGYEIVQVPAVREYVELPDLDD